MKELRDATALSQQQLADYTQQPRSNISLFELNLRTLPTEALVDLVALFQCLPANTQANSLSLLQDVIADQADKAQKATKRHQQKRKLLKKRKEKTLEKLEKKYQQSLNLLQAIRTLRNSLPVTAENQYKHEWLNLTERQTITQLETCSLGEQQVLRLEINELSNY